MTNGKKNKKTEVIKMDELIKIEKQIINNDEVNSVNARDLWVALESKQDFSTWIKARLEQAYAVENEDYGVFHKTVENLKGGRPQDLDTPLKTVTKNKNRS